MSIKLIKKLCAFACLFITLVLFTIFIFVSDFGKNITLTLALVFLITTCLLFANKKDITRPILTKYSEKVTKNPWPEYPRPQLERESYVNLNGEWEYVIKKVNDDTLPDIFVDKIIVPYPLESILSHVQKSLKKGDTLFYRKTFRITDKIQNDRLLLHFGSVDQLAKVYINKTLVHESSNGYIPFTIDITDFVNPLENEIIVAVKDDLDNTYPYGKQSKKRGGMWYTPVSGIWQTVWLESVCRNYITDIKYDCNIDEETIQIAVHESNSISLKEIIIETPNGPSITKSKDEITVIHLVNPNLWSPESPYLYQVTITTETDIVKSYFAFRKISVGVDNNKKVLLLNNHPYFFNGLLDQGYYSDGLYTAATIKTYIDELTTIKELGFNTLRKHIKIEPLIWYSLCDKMGIVVFQDMVNNSKYHFFRDTVLPFKVRNLNDCNFKVKAKNKEIFIDSMKKTVDLLYNVPSICLWTIFNEGWGQFEGERLYDILSQIDKTRIIDTASGWFETGKSDVTSLHVYFKDIEIPLSDKPIIISEFGGLALRIPGHIFNVSNQYGYGFCKTTEELSEKYRQLYNEQIIANINQGLCGAIYTQVSDVEDELNGFFTYDRHMLKFDEKVIKEVNDKIDEYNRKMKEETHE